MAAIPVQAASATSSTAVSTLAATFTAPVTAGNTLVAYYALGGQHSVTINDNVNNTNFNADVSLASSTRNTSVGIQTFFATASGTPTVTLHIGLNLPCALIVEEWSGFPGPLDQTITFASSGASTALTVGPTGTLSQSNEVALCAVLTNLQRTLTANSPWQSGNITAIGTTNDFGTENQLTLSTSGVTGSFTANASTQWVGVVATYKAGGAVTLSLSGQTVSSSNGILGATVTPPLTAQTLTSTEGIPLLNPVPVPLGSQTAFFTIGVPGTSTFTLTGQTLTSAEGSLTVTQPVGDVTLGLSAVFATFLEGRMLNNVSYVLDSNFQGINLIGQTFTSAEGVLPPAILGVPLTAQSVTSAEGTLTQGQSVTLGATTLASVEGIISAVSPGNVTVAIESITATFAEGSIALEADYFPTALTATSAEGVITFSSTTNQTFTLGSITGVFSEGIIASPSQPQGTGPPLFIPPQLGKPVTTRTFSWLEMASRAWGSEFRAPDHRIYRFSGGNYKDSTDMGQTGIYSPNLGPQDNP